MPKWLRPWILARAGISLVWQRKLMRFLLMFAWLPIIFPAFFIFAFEFSINDPESLVGLLASPPISQPELAMEVVNDPEAARHQVWSLMILTFFRYPQAIAMVMLVGLIAPMMISYDLRSKAYLMYFSRPLTPSEYLLGKSAVVWFYLAMISTIPAMVVYLMGVLLSPELSVLAQTWDIPLRILAASAVLLLPTTAVALCYSSMSSESRYTTFSWFATWIMGIVAYRILTWTTFEPPRGSMRDVRPEPPMPGEFEAEFEEAFMEGDFGPPPEQPPWPEFDLDAYRGLSPYDTLGKVQAWVFDLDTTPASVTPFLTLLVVVTVICLWWTRRRIVKRLSV